VPQSITVISSDLIKDQGMRSMGDVVRYVPGVSMGQGEGHRDAPTLRGNSTTADFFIDGVRDDVQYFRDLYNAERIEVLKGPNAMIFGRGGGGGVINRVTEQADWSTRREATLQGGSDDHKRIAADVGQGVNELLALRLNAMYEDSDSYRDFANLERYAINPTATINLSDATLMRFGYEYFNDERTVDRGVPSQNGRPVRVDESTFVGNPALSFGEATVSLANLTVLHDFSPNLRLRNHTSFGDYDKFYQNVHANSAVSATGNVTLQAYNSGTERRNLFNQTDVTWKIATGAIEHTLLGGVELGRQETDNTRTPNTTPGTVNIANPTTFAPVTFGTPLQANNRVDLDLSAVYLQDQMALSAQFQVIAGIRFDRFDLDFDDKRPANTDFSRKDDLVSPRLGAIYKPVEPVSLYASYSISYLPQSGDQFASLTATTAALEPEEFENIEVGAKWDLRSDLAFTAALYQLDRTNTTAIDPVTSQTVLTGEQRSKGIELGLGGTVMDRWEIMAGYAYQEAEITRTSTAAPAGRTVALVPKHQVSLWNSYRFTPMWRAAVGVTHQSDVYASISNAVTLPSYTRVDAAVFFTLNPHLQVQLNVENVLDETYLGTAHNDNNITPGSPTAFRLALTARY
jgi:catecholate siderophore receptor